MRISLSILGSILFGISLYAQPEWPPRGDEGVDFNLRNADGSKTGLWYRTYSEGGLYYVGYFEKGKPKPGSTLYYYYETGQPMAKHSFRKDPKVVDAIHFYSSGIKQSEGKYYRQKRDSTWKFFDERAKLRSIEEYLADSLHGEKKVFYPSGQVLKVERFDNGSPIGEFVEYYENGNFRTKGSYVNGEYEGDFTYYYSNGNKEAEGRFSNGLREGQWLYFMKDGPLQAQVLYKTGKVKKEVIQNGEHVEYYESGIPKLECNYKNGELHGLYTEYYDQGEWIREPMETNSPGVALEFTEKLIKRQPSKECEYINGKLKGEVLYYSPEGELTRTELYENGELIETIQED